MLSCATYHETLSVTDRNASNLWLPGDLQTLLYNFGQHDLLISTTSNLCSPSTLHVKNRHNQPSTVSSVRVYHDCWSDCGRAVSHDGHVYC